MISSFHGGALPQDDCNERQFLIPFRVEDDGPQPDELITLRLMYERWMLPEISHLQPTSLCEDRNALGHWERHTGNPDVRDARENQREYLTRLRDGMKADGRSDATINKTWRELKSMFSYASNELRLIDQVPQIAYRMRSKLVIEKPKVQRETLRTDEITRLWRACSKATYPSGKGQFPAPKLWRVAIVLFYTYGPRTEDVVKHLRWDNIKFHDRMIQFMAMKTRKLQGLPLTDLVIEHLHSIRGVLDKPFGTFKTTGALLKAKAGKPAKWLRGWRTTWRNEILPAAGFRDGDVDIQNFRETMLTNYNTIEPGLGSWIAAHAEKGTSAKFYDLPTRRIREAIEGAPMPECFKEIG